MKTRSGGSGHEIPLSRLQALAAENPHRGKRLLHRGGLELLRLHEELLQAAEHLDRGPADPRRRGVPMISPPPPQPSRVRAASRSFRAAVRRLHTPRPAEMVLTGSVLPIPVQGELQITDERIGDEPYCYYRLSSSGDPRWIWGPDLRANVREIPIYRLQGARS